MALTVTRLHHGSAPKTKGSYKIRKRVKDHAPAIAAEAQLARWTPADEEVVLRIAAAADSARETFVNLTELSDDDFIQAMRR